MAKDCGIRIGKKDENSEAILEKVLLDPILMILKCELFTHFGSCFLKLYDVSTSQLEAWSRDVFFPKQFPRKKTSRD